jgi:hypothetical protein
MPTKQRSGTGSADKPKRQEANLGQKEAQMEKDKKSELSNMSATTSKNQRPRETGRKRPDR